MDRVLARLEREHQQRPDDRELALELAAAWLRAGRPRRALELARPWGPAPVRLAAADELARRAGLSGAELDPLHEVERLLGPDGLVLVLVPGGAFLDEGDRAPFGSPGYPVGLRRALLPDLLVEVEPQPALVLEDALARARRHGGRLPAPEEWMKAWRGGLFLDGDATARRPNPLPDRDGPWGTDDPPRPGRAAVSPYGALFRPDACEWAAGLVGMILDAPNHRYAVSLRTSDDRRGRRLLARVVRELPPEA